MKWLEAIRRHLGLRIFISHLMVLAIGVIVFGLAAQWQAGGLLMRAGDSFPLILKIDPISFLVIAASVSVTIAGVVSISTTRRILSPIQEMMRASQRMAAGDYHNRVKLHGQDELGALAQSYNQMAEVLEQTEQRRLELIGNVAHELRTPLASIKSVLAGIVDGVLPNDLETMVGVQREVTRMQSLVHDLEELSRIEAKQIRLDLRLVALPQLINSVVERLRTQFEDKGVTLVLDVQPDLRFEMDSDRMTQVLLNLLGNALQYTPVGGTVTVRARRDRSELFIAVQDTGIGISGEHLPHVFERFYRVDKSRSRPGGGSGIGLTIAMHLVQAHGGHLRAASDGLGKGSTFTVALPGSA